MVQIGILDCSFLCDAEIFHQKTEQVSPERRALVERHKTEKGKRQSLGGELLVQAMLEQAMQKQWAAPYSSFSWEKGGQGKPILRGVTNFQGHPLYVNLSHSGELAAAVLADFESGIDIQELQKSPGGVAKRFFTKEEQMWIQQAEAGKRVERFFRIWTLKEAYIKTTGEGMRTPFTSFDVTVAARQEGVTVAARGENTTAGEKVFLCTLPMLSQSSGREQRYALAVGGKQPFKAPKPEFLSVNF